MEKYRVVGISALYLACQRAVAQFGRALDSKSSGWGFESLLPCRLGGREWELGRRNPDKPVPSIFNEK